MKKLCHSFCLFLGVFLIWQAHSFPIANRYKSLMDINGYLKKESINHPEISKFLPLGISTEGRDIASLLLSNGFDKKKPAIYFNAGHHGNEQNSVEALVGLIQFIVNNKTKKEVVHFLNKYILIIHPLVNPDGLAYGTRNDSLGRDPNRDYPHPKKLNHMESFLLPETRIVKFLHDTYPIVGAVAVHSGMEGVLWPWCFTEELNPEHSKFIHLSEKTAKAMGFNYFKQSFHDYETKGEYIDWAYTSYGTLAITLEVSHRHIPDFKTINTLVQKTVKGAFAFIEAITSIKEQSNNDG